MADDAPPAFFCPISMELMRDPVSTADGHCYERASIERWFAQGSRTSPKTGEGNPEKLHKKWADLSRAAEGEEKLLKGETDRVNDVRVIFYHNTMRKTLDRMEVVSFQQFKPR